MKKLLLATAATLALSAPAWADTFTADTVSVIGGVSVHITDTNSPPSNGGNVLAGEIQLHNNASNSDLLVWCLDIFDSINLPYTYQINTYNAGDSRPGMAVLDATQVRQIAGLMLLGNTQVSDAAVQLAIWRVEYGPAFGDNASGTLATQANFAVANSTVGGILDCSNCVLTVLSDAPNAPSQAFGLATIAPVPGPLVGAGIPGLMAAFSFFGLNRLRRRKQTTAA